MNHAAKTDPISRLVSNATLRAIESGDERDQQRLTSLIVAATVAATSDLPAVQAAADQFLSIVRLAHDEHAALLRQHAEEVAVATDHYRWLAEQQARDEHAARHRLRQAQGMPWGASGPPGLPPHGQGVQPAGSQPSAAEIYAINDFAIRPR